MKQFSTVLQYRLDFTAHDFNQIMGYQFTLEYDEDLHLLLQSIEAGAIEVGSENFGVKTGGIITTSWDKMEGISIEEGEVLFTLVFEAQQTVQPSSVLSVSSMHTKAEAYTTAGQIMNVALRFVQQSDAYVLYQNIPNPFTSETTIGFDLPRAMEGTLTIFDVSGRMLTTHEGRLQPKATMR